MCSPLLFPTFLSGEIAISREENKVVSRRVNEECFNQGNLAVADEYVAADYVDHAAPPGLAAGMEGFKQLVTAYRAAAGADLARGDTSVAGNWERDPGPPDQAALGSIVYMFIRL